MKTKSNFQRFIDSVHEEAEYRIGKRINKKITENAMWFVVGSLASTMMLKQTNFYGVTLARSGTGKDATLKTIENVFEPFCSKFTENVTSEFKMLNGTLPEGNETDGEVDYIVPTSYKVPVRGTIEGFMRVANFFNKIDIGSLNVISSEIGNDFSSSDAVEVLVELWEDGNFNGMNTVNEKYKPVENVRTNMLLFGSQDVFKNSESKLNQLRNLVTSGLGRRSLFVWIDYENIELLDKNDRISDMEMLKDYAEKVVEHAIKLSNENAEHGRLVPISTKAQELLSEYRQAMVDIYNKDNTGKNQIQSIKIESEYMIRRFSRLVAILDLSNAVEPRHMKYAIEYLDRSVDDMATIIEPSMAYMSMFELLKHNKKMNVTEFIEKGIIFRSKQDKDLQFELLEDLAFRKNMNLKINGNILRMSPLPKTDINKIIMSIAPKPEGRKEPMSIVGCKAVKVPFFGKKPSVEAAVKDGSIGWYSFAHFKDDKRSSKNAIPKQNCIAFDIDTGMTIEEAKNLLTPYTYIIATTRSHQKEKNGETKCDRFRIILPTKIEFSLNNEQHKGMMENIADILELPVYDESTRDISRGWYPNENAEIFTNEGELFDVSCCIPNTEKEEKVMQAMSSIDTTSISENGRIQGMIRWALTNSIVGNRNVNLMRLHRFVKDLTGSKEEADSIVYSTNQMLTEPLSEIELQRTVCR